MGQLSYFRFYSDFPFVLNAVLACGFVTLWAVSFYRLSGVLSRKKLLFFAGIKALVFLMLFLFLLNPTLGFSHRTVDKPLLAVLIDTSRSMTIADAEADAPRIDQVKKFVETHGLFPPKAEGQQGGELANFSTVFYAFDDLVRNLAPADWPALAAAGSHTRLDLALRIVAQNIRDRNPAGIAVFSDGRTEMEEDVEAICSRIGIPVYTVTAGKEEAVSGYRNVRVESVDRPKFCEIDKAVPIKVEIQNSGHQNQPARVVLREGDQVLKSESILLTRDKDRLIVSLEYKPQTVGRKTLSATLEDVQEEDLSDNSRKFQIFVTQPNDRVLLICGRLKWDYAFLARLLRRDPAVRLETAVRVDEKGWMLNGARQTDALSFSREMLFGYAAVILMDVERQFFSDYQLQNLVDFVSEKGGGFCMMGRQFAFAQGGYRNSPVEKMLPVLLGEGPGGEQAGEPVRAEVTADGKRHPVLWVSPEAGAKGDFWKILPPLGGYTRMGKLRQGAQVLLASGPGDRADALLAVQQFGQGRAMVFGGFESWNWAMKASDASSQKAYGKLWSQAVRWLMRAKREGGGGEEQMFLYAAKDAYTEDENVVLRLKLPQGGAESAVDADLVLPDGQKTRIGFRKVRPEDDVLESAFIAQKPGTYKIEAKSSAGASGEGLSLAVEVYPRTHEMDRRFSNGALMARIAQMTGGKTYRLDSAKALLSDVRGKSVERTGLDEVNLTQNWFFFLFLVLLLTTEWITRKMSNLG